MNTIVCPKCKKYRPATTRPCWNCGHVLTTVNPQPTPQPVVIQVTTTPTSTKQATSGLASLMAGLIVIALLFAVFYGLFQNPAVQEQWQQLSQSVSQLSENVGSESGLLSGGEFTCPEGIYKLEFDTRGVLQEPYPTLQVYPQRYCFDKAKYEAFLNASGKTESGREINGLDWLAETIVYPSYPNLLDAVKKALQTINTASNMPNVGWIEIPGHGGAQPAPSDGQNQPGPGNWFPQPTALPPTATLTPTPFVPPTATAMPTIAAADIPTLAPSTPMPDQYSILNFTPEPTQQAILATKSVDVMQQNCVTVVEATNFWDLDTLPFWTQGVTYLEFRLGENGAYALSNKVGGDGPDAFKHWACVRQITNWPGDTITFKNNIVGTWNGAQVRVSPQYGVGDWISNGKECGANGLWLFQCSVTYPPGTPTPTLQMPPTATPRATNMSLDDLINLFIKNQWSRQPSCQINGDQVLIRLGACTLLNNPSYWVNFSPIWDRRKGDNIVVGPCGQLDSPKLEWKDTDTCLYPFE